MNIFNNIKKELPDFKFSFDKETELKFRLDYIDKTLVVIRAGYFLCIFLYAVFGFLDIWIVPETKNIAWFIRFVIVIPTLIFIIILSFYGFFKRYQQLLLIISSFIVGFGIVMMIAFSQPDELGYKYYYSGLILVIIWIYTFIRLRFWNSIISGLLITLSYELVAIFGQHLLDGGMESKNMLVFINNNFFFLSANIIGLWASYNIEKLYRSNFRHSQKIKEESIRIMNISETLSQKNEEIITQRLEIETQRDILSEQNELLETQKQSILQQNIELQESNATKDKFFSIIAHDLKNSFSNILAFSGMMIMDAPSVENKRLLKSASAINNSTLEAFKLLENLLDWASTQTGEIEFHQEKITLSEVLNSILDQVKADATNKNIRFSVQSNDDIEVFVDHKMLAIIFRNLISNAIKYSYKGGTIEIQINPADDKVMISIKDSGTGIDPYILDKLFKINEKVSTPGTERESGTGLGLLLCKEFIDKHDGQILVESEVGKGSSFSFTIPLWRKNG